MRGRWGALLGSKRPLEIPAPLSPRGRGVGGEGAWSQPRSSARDSLPDIIPRRNLSRLGKFHPTEKLSDAHRARIVGRRKDVFVLQRGRQADGAAELFQFALQRQR